MLKEPRISSASSTRGSYVTGPKVSGKDIRGKVVVIEYWGITCGPCIEAIPHTTELAKKYGHDKLVIIANQSWSASNSQTKKTWRKHAKNNMVMVVNGGKLKGFKAESVPHVFIFDHTGKSVWQGFPGMMDQPLAEAIANLPKPDEDGPAKAGRAENAGPPLIVKGLEPEYFVGEVRLINAQNRKIASTLAKLRRAAQRSSRQEQMDEAAAIVSAVESWAKGQQAKTDAALKHDPATAYTAAMKLVSLLDGDDLAKRAAEIIAQIEEEDELFDQVRATITLRSILAQAKSIGLPDDPAVAHNKDNARTVRLITRDLGRLIRAYPETDAGQQALTLQRDWGLGE